MQAGDFSVRLPGNQTGIAGKIADTFNDIVSTNQRMAQQLERVGDVVGKQGKTRQRVQAGLRQGRLGRDGNLRQHADRRSALADRAKSRAPSPPWPRAICCRPCNLDVDGRPLKGEFLRSANIVNTMIKQLSVFTSEVTRVAREVGTEGKLGGQAQVQRSDRRVEGSDRKRQLHGLAT